MPAVAYLAGDRSHRPPAPLITPLSVGSIIIANILGRAGGYPRMAESNLGCKDRVHLGYRSVRPAAKLLRWYSTECSTPSERINSTQGLAFQ